MFQNREIISAFAVWLIGTLLFGIVGGRHILPQLKELHILSQSGLHTVGEVTEVTPQDHNSCEYRFTYNNQNYTHAGRNCGNYTPKQPIEVYFLPDHPDTSINGNAQGFFINDLVSFITGMTILPLLAAVATYIKSKREQ